MPTGDALQWAPCGLQRQPQEQLLSPESLAGSRGDDEGSFPAAFTWKEGGIPALSSMATLPLLNLHAWGSLRSTA